MDKHPTQIIAEKSPEAVGLMAKLMDHSARERESIEAHLQSALERERDEWRDRALEAEARIDRIYERLMGMMD